MDAPVPRQRRSEAAAADDLIYARLRAEQDNDKRQDRRAWTEWSGANAARVWSRLD